MSPQDLLLELAFTRADKASELHKLFFTSQRTMAFLVARILGGGALCGLFHDDLPPIKNPALPGMIDQQVTRLPAHCIRRTMIGQTVVA